MLFFTEVLDELHISILSNAGLFTKAGETFTCAMMFHGAVDLSIDRFFMRMQNNHNVCAHHTYYIQLLVCLKCRVMQDSFF
jgi:hypothetical protein